MIELRVSCRMRLDLLAPTAASRHTVREVFRSELDGLADDWLLPPLTVAFVDSLVDVPWRCFAATDGSNIIHHSFVAMQEPAPLLFRCLTVPGQRRRGAFASTVAKIATTLHAEGHVSLESSTTSSNKASIRAHHGAGFRTIRRRVSAIVLGVDVRSVFAALARRLLK